MLYYIICYRTSCCGQTWLGFHHVWRKKKTASRHFPARQVRVPNGSYTQTRHEQMEVGQYWI